MWHLPVWHSRGVAAAPVSCDHRTVCVDVTHKSYAESFCFDDFHYLFLFRALTKTNRSSFRKKMERQMQLDEILQTVP